jgi:uncharacterized protein (DUF1501 family)
VSALAQGGPECGDYKALVCVFLFGGNDGNNTVIPLTAGDQNYTAYARARGILALPQDQLLPVQTKDGQATYGLHPGLAGLQELYNKGRVAVLCNVGMLVKPLTRAQYQQPGAVLPVNLFSHSDQQAQWQSGVAAGNAATGWAGRTADLLQSCNSPSTFPGIVSMAGNNLFCTGQQTRPITVSPGAAMGLQGFGTIPNPRYEAFQQLLSFDNGLRLVQAYNGVTKAGLANAEVLNRAVSGASRITTPFPATSIGQQLRLAARIIEAREALGLKRQIFFCSMGGFDTHTAQLPNQAALLGQLGAALAAFYNATVELNVDQKVTAFTESEFGRTYQASSGNGSDHGWGSHHFIVGGAVKGGDCYGRYPTLAIGGPDDTAARGVWIPTTSLDQYSATLAAWFGVTPADLAALFPNLANFPAATLGFLS